MAKARAWTSRHSTTIGKELARANAVSKVWELEGYVAASTRDNAQPLPHGETTTSTREAYDIGHYHGYRDGKEAK